MDDTKQEQASAETQVGVPPVPTVEEEVSFLRNYLGNIERTVRTLKYSPGMTDDPALRNEAIAQSMLAVRHLEDARMRLGKVLQYGVQGGVSKYDVPATVPVYVQCEQEGCTNTMGPPSTELPRFCPDHNDQNP